MTGSQTAAAGLRVSAVVLLAAGLLFVLAGMSVAAPPKSPSEVRAYWTKERMQNAVPLETLLPDLAPTAAGVSKTADRGAIRNGKSVTAKRVKNVRSKSMRRHGRAFGTVEGIGDFSCSATSVKAPNRSLVWTAGHCLSLAEIGIMIDNFSFVPAYDKGDAPFGVWPATTMRVPQAWLNSGEQFGMPGSQIDFGAAVVAEDAHGRRLADVVGARKLRFNPPRKTKLTLLGYPAAEPFDGERMFRCASKYRGVDRGMPTPHPTRVACDMTGGSSGGAWIGRKGRQVSVTSYGPNWGGRLYGPYQGRAAKRLYEQTRSLAP